jgi:hypothetical protein
VGTITALLALQIAVTAGGFWYILKALERRQ